MPIATLYVTWPSEAQAAEAARTLLEERLIACANLFPARSIYRWEGAVEEAQEVVMIAKSARPARARDRIVDLHPYTCPCVTVWALDVTVSHLGYMDWLLRESGPAD